MKPPLWWPAFLRWSGIIVPAIGVGLNTANLMEFPDQHPEVGIFLLMFNAALIGTGAYQAALSKVKEIAAEQYEKEQERLL